MGRQKRIEEIIALTKKTLTIGDMQRLAGSLKPINENESKAVVNNYKKTHSKTIV